MKTESFQIGLTNKLGHELRLERVYAVSGQGAGEKEMMLVADVGEVPAAKTLPIADGQRVTMRMHFENMLSSEVFQDWKTFQITAIYNGGQIDRENIAENTVAAVYRSFNPSPIAPQVRAAADPFRKNVAGPPIEWRLDKPVTVFFYSRKIGDAVRIEAIQIHATNKTEKPLRAVSAKIIPDMKQEAPILMRVNPHGIVQKPEESAVLIPPRAQFDLMAPIPPKKPCEGVTAEEFLKAYGGFGFEFKYDGGHTDSQYFPLSYLEDQIAYIEERTRKGL